MSCAFLIIILIIIIIIITNPILIWVYQCKQGWPDLPHSNSNLSNSHFLSCSIHGILFLQTNTLALLLLFLSSSHTSVPLPHILPTFQVPFCKQCLGLHLSVCGRQVQPTPAFWLAGAHVFLLSSNQVFRIYIKINLRFKTGKKIML